MDIHNRWLRHNNEHGMMIFCGLTDQIKIFFEQETFEVDMCYKRSSAKDMIADGLTIVDNALPL